MVHSCKSVQPFSRNVDDKEISIAASRDLPELIQNVNRSSHGHSTPSLKISCKSVQPFSRNVVDRETKKERNRPKTIPRPPTGGGVIMQLLPTAVLCTEKKKQRHDISGFIQFNEINK